MLDMQGPLAKTNTSPAIPNTAADRDYGPLLLMWEVGRIIYSFQGGRDG